MTTLTMKSVLPLQTMAGAVNSHRIGSIDLLRGTVMIIMALDHVRDYFHADAFYYNPTDLSHTSIFLFSTRWITHFCAPAFVLLAGISACLHGSKKSTKELSFFLFTRGLWLVVAELFLVTLGWTFNPSYHIFNLQVIWATGISMIALSLLVYLRIRFVAVIAFLLIGGHNLLDVVHVPGTGAPSIAWSLLHEEGDFKIGNATLMIHYPVLPWIGIMAAGFCMGKIYTAGFDPDGRRTILLSAGVGAIALFVLLRYGNLYGDPQPWASQDSVSFTVLSFINVSKYPPSLQYILLTSGPALLFLGLAERPLNRMARKITVLGRVPFFYYVLHIYLIHLLAIAGATLTGYNWSDMILRNRVNRVPALKGYGFNLFTVYVIWIAVVLLLYPLCQWYDRYKKSNLPRYKWLSYL